MSIESLIRQPCVLTKRAASGAVDEYGDEVLAETQVETVCALQQRRREEEGDAGENSESDWVAFFLPDEDVDTASKLVQGTRTFEFVGSPWPVEDHLRGIVHHIEATVRIAA